jgi:hypothetical protein
MSPLRPPIGPHCNLKIIRLKNKFEKGIKLRDCDYILLYSSVCGRIIRLENNRDNWANVPEYQGFDKAGIRKLILTPNFPMTKMTSTDVLVVPWGVRPNTFVSPSAPDSLGPIIHVKTPLGIRVLEWNGLRYSEAGVSELEPVGGPSYSDFEEQNSEDTTSEPTTPEPPNPGSEEETIQLAKINGSWCFTGMLNFCFNSNNILCERLPRGYSIIKSTGPDAFFEILRINTHQDDKGLIAYYELLLDHLKQGNSVLQE